MLNTFFDSLTATYKEHIWIKISAFLGLVLTAGMVVGFSGGFPPWAWRFSAHVLAQLPTLWAAQGASLVPALLGLLLISLSLLIVWIVLVFLLIKIGFQIWSDLGARRHFARDLAEAEFLAQEQIDWTREQDENDRRMWSAYQSEPPRYRPANRHISREQATDNQRERPSTAPVHDLEETRGASTSRVRRTVPLIPARQPEEEFAAYQQFRPIGLPQRNMHAEVSTVQTAAPRRLHMVPHFSATATVEDSVLPASFHHQRLAPAPTLDRQAVQDAFEDEEISSVWGERKQHYAEQDTRPAHNWWEDDDAEAEEDIFAVQDEEQWGENLATQPINDLDDMEDGGRIDVIEDLDGEAEVNEQDESVQKTGSEKLASMHTAMLPEEDWSEEDEAPTQKGAVSRRQTPLARAMLDEEMAAPLSEEGGDAQIQEQLGTTDVPRDIRLVIGIGLDPGLSRKHSPNEDSVFAIEGMRVTDRGPQPAGLFIVADGMGGHANGREASHMAVNSMSDAIIPSLLRETCDRSKDEEETLFQDMLKQGVHQANLALYQKNREAHSSMGTTLTAALVVNLTAYIVNVGDSRTYLYRPTEGLMQVTRDHSVVARMVEVGAISKDDVYTHPKRNQIYRCLGEHASVDIDAFTVPVRIGDILLLCSDGLWEMVRDPDLEHIIDEGSNPSQMSSQLVQAALQGGGADNIGAIVVALADAAE